ncbi:RES family NAD+ phosphorylase [Arvimicrobium flavum]|uniref:RES family NAD+ phosphorylase n=1 Tax=Arvimicrobium flavum TaxID=3393320 RepID=UPI00237AEDA8|nr:RES family NAD+ phosphorylase [Mesorhizobium shangrilense]
MRLWRLSGHEFASVFDGGYGLRFDGRWNTAGHATTYVSTSPSLCVLEKLVHVEDPTLLPALDMVAYDVPDGVPVARLTLSDLPGDWRRREAETQQIGDTWLSGQDAAVLFVPSAIVALPESPDENAIINHRHPAASTIQIAWTRPFELDIRLF